VTTSDEALTKGYLRYLVARLIDMAKEADRVVVYTENLIRVDDVTESLKLAE
jgi:hypothetical protein